VFSQLESIRRAGGWCEMAASLGVSCETFANKDVNTETEESAALKPLPGDNR
jgi:hypothetical protein